MNRGPQLIEKIVKSRVLFPMALIFSISAWALTPYNWIVALIYSIMTVFLWNFERHFSLFRTKSQLHLTFFVLFSTLTPTLHTNIAGSIIMLLVGISLYILYDSYQQRDAVLALHFIGIIAGIGALIDAKTTLFIFLIWFIAYQVQAIHFKGFVSSLLGIVLPIILWIAYLVVNNDIAQFYEFIGQYKYLYIPQILTYQWMNWTVLGSITFLVIIATVSILKNSHYDKIRTSTYINLTSITSLFLIIYIFIFSDRWTITIPLLYGISSLLVGHYFTKKKGRFIGISLVLIILLIAVMGTYKIIELK